MGVSGSFTNAANWSTGLVPTGTATITRDGTYTVFLNMPQITASLYMKPDAKCDVVVTNQLLVLTGGALKCTIGKNGFTPIRSASWNTGSTTRGRKLIVDGTAFQKAGGSGWVTIATNTTAFADSGVGNRRFVDADITLLHEGVNAAKPFSTYYREWPHHVEVYIPGTGGTLLMVR